MMNKCIGARSKGRNHDICQDEILYKNYEHISVIAVCDGAGSKEYSHIGARISLYCLNRMLKAIDHDRAIDELNIEAFKDELLYEIKSAIKLEAWKNDRAISEYASTMVFTAIIGGKSFITGHIGDGIILAYVSDHLEPISEAENGEYKNETYFLTDADVNKHFVINKYDLSDEHKAFLVCTDGIADLVYQKRENGYVISEAAKHMCEWLIEASDEEEIANIGLAYESNLKDVFSTKSRDDLSICVWAR